MEDIEYLDEYKDLVLPGIKGDVRPSAGARRRRISSDSSNSSSLDADIFQKLFLDKSVDDDLLNLNEAAGSKSRSRRHLSPSSSDESNDALDALFNRKLGKPKPNKRRERYDSFDSVDDLGQALMRSTHRSTVPKPSTSHARAKKSHSDALYRSRSSSNSSARGKSSSSKPKPAATAVSGKGAATAAPSLGGKYKNPGKPNSVNGSSNAGKNKAVTILKAQKTDLKPPKHEPKTDPLNLTEFFEDSDSDSSYTYESDFFGDHDSADEDAEPVIDISTDTSRTTSLADTVTPVVSDDEGQEPQREEDEQNARSQASIMSSVYERLQSYLNNLSCAEAPPIYKKQSFARKSRSNEKKPSSSEQVKHANERPAASDKVHEEEKEKEREPAKASGSAHSSPAKAAGRSTNSSAGKSSTSTSAGASRRLFEVDDDLTLETLERMTQDLAEQILEIDVERSVEYQKRSGSKHRSRSTSKIPGEPGTASDLAKSHVRKLTYSSERLDNGSEPQGTELRRSKSESAFPKGGRPRGKKQRKSRAATTEDSVLSSAKEGEGTGAPVPVKRKRGRPPKKQAKEETLAKPETVAKDQEVSMETSGADEVKEQDLLGQQETPEEREREPELNAELEKAKEFAGFTSQDDISMSSCHPETDLKSAPDRASTLDEDAAQNLDKEPHPTLDTSTESFDTAVDNTEVTERVTKPQEPDNTDWPSQPEPAQEEHTKDATMAIKELEEIESAIETAGEIALTPELADALDASPDVQATPVTGNILEESDSQLAEDIKLAEEILAAEVGKGIEATGDQNPVIDIVKELEQETITEVVGKSEESSSLEGETEVKEPSPAKKHSPTKEQSPAKEESPAKEQSPAKEPSPVKDKSPAKEKSPAKRQTPAKEQSGAGEQSPAKEELPAREQTPAKEQSPAKEPSPSKELSPAKEPSPEKKPSLNAEETPNKEQLVPVEAQEQSATEEQSQAEEKTPDEENPAPSKEPEDAPRLDTPTKKRNCATPAKSKELEAAEASVARRALRSDKPESKPGTPETTPIKQRKSRAKLPLRSDVLMDDLSRRSSPRLGRSPAESHSSQERSPVSKRAGRSKLANEKSITEANSPTVEVEPKDKNTEEANDSVKDVPVTDATKLAEEKPSSDETDVEKAEVKPFKKRGQYKNKKTSKLIEEQSTSSESEQKEQPVKVQADDSSESPAEQSKAENSEAEKIEEKPSSPRKSRSRRSRWDKVKAESDSHTESSEVEKEKHPSRTSSRGKPETSADDSASTKEEPISTRVSRGDKLKSQKETSPSPAKSHSSRGRGSKKDKMEENEPSTSKERNPKSKNRRDKSESDKGAGYSSDPKETEPEKSLKKGRSRKVNPKPETSAEPDTLAKEDAQEENVKEKSKSRKGRGDNKPKENISTETKPKVAEDAKVDVETVPTKSESTENLTQSSSKIEPGTSEVVRGRIKKRRRAVSIEDSDYDQVDTPSSSLSSESVPLSTIQNAVEPKTRIQMKAGKRNQPPTPKGEESEAEVVASGSKGKLKEKKRKAAPNTTATTPSEVTSEKPETMPEESAQKDAKNTSSNSPSKFQFNVPVGEPKTEPQTPSTSASCRKFRVLIKRTPTSNLKSKDKVIGTSTKRKKFKRILESIEETAGPDLVDTPSKPKPESQAKSDNIPKPSEDEDLKEVAEKATDDTPGEVPKDEAKEATSDIQEDVPKEAAEQAIESQEKPQDKLETLNQEETVSEKSTNNTTIEEAPAVQDPENEPPKPLDTDVLSKEEAATEETLEDKETHDEKETQEEEATSKEKETQEEEETSKEKQTQEEEETREEEATPKEEETNEKKETSKEKETQDKEETHKPSAETLEEAANDPDSSAKEIPTEDPEDSPTNVGESTPSPIPDPTETETTGVTVVDPVKRSMRKREADSPHPDAAAKRKQHADMKLALQKRQDLIRNARRRRQQEEEERPALKRTKTDTAPSKDSERHKFISMIGNETIMTSPSKEPRSEQPQTSQAAKRAAAAAAARGPHYTEITKHVIIPAPNKKPLDEKPTGSSFKKPMVQTLLSSSLNLRKPLPGESLASPDQGRKSLSKPEVEASKPNLNSSLVLTKKALLPPSKKTESPAKEDVPKTSATAPRKVNISVSVVPSKDTVATLEKSPVLPRKVHTVEAQKAARKLDVKKKVEPKETPTASSLDKSKPKMLPKSKVATDNLSKKTDSPAMSARKSLQAELARKIEARKSEGQALNSRKAPLKSDLSKKIEARRSEGAASSAMSARKPLQPPQRSAAKEIEPQKSEEATKAPSKSDLSKKIEARKSEGATSSALSARKALQPPQRIAAKETEPHKSEDATKAVKSSVSGATEEVAAVPKGRETAKKALTELRKETAATARMEKPTVAVTPRTVSLAKTVHMTRAASSTRSLAPTPTPVSERQRNTSKERLPPPSGQTEAPQEPQPSGQRGKGPRGRAGRFKRIPAAQKRKALEAAEARDAKRLKELSKEEQEQESRSAAFPVKITAADLAEEVDPLKTQAPQASQKRNVPKPPVQEVKQRKLRIKINRRVVSKWLKENQAKKQAQPRKLPPPSDDMASDTESAAESMSESMNTSRPEPRAVLLPPVPPLAPISVPVSATTAASAPAPPLVAPVPLPALIAAPVLAPLLPDPDEARRLEEARKLDALRRVQMNPTLPMPLPVPIAVAEVKSEPEDASPEPMEADFQEALPLLEALPPARAPPTPLVAEGTPSVGASSRQVISVMSTPGDRRASNEIPSASAPGASNANSFGHTKMFSFLYPNRHSGKYSEVGLDFCCPNLDGPMAAIDPTRLHAKVEAPVLEMPQYLVITTKFISKADKNIPNKVRAKLELLGKDKDLNSSAGLNVSATAATGTPVPQRKSSAPLVPPIIPPPAAAPPSSAAAAPPVPAASIDSLTKQLPRGTTLTKKVLPPGAAIPPTASDSMAASLPLSLIQLPTLCPGDQQRMELQTRVQVFDLVLQALSRRAATLTVAERQRTIEEIVKTSTLMPIDLDVGTKMLENYVHYLNKATMPPVPPEVQVNQVIPPPATPVVAKVAVPPVVATSSPVIAQNIVGSPATPQQDPFVTKKPVYDSHRNIIGYKCSSVKPVVSTPRRKATPVPAATSTPLASAASTSSAAAAAAAAAVNADPRFLELDRITVEANQRKFIDLPTTIPLKQPGPKPSGKGTVHAIKPGPKTKTVVPPVGKVASPATRVPPATRGPATRGPPPPVKPSAPPLGTIAPPSLSCTANPNVFIINQASHAEESILPDSSNVEAPLAAEIKGELDDSSEAII